MMVEDPYIQVMDQVEVSMTPPEVLIKLEYTHGSSLIHDLEFKCL